MVISRKQLSMVLPAELLEAIKDRAQQKGLSVTAYVSELVMRDLGMPVAPDPRELAEGLDQLKVRVEELEQRHQSL
jgi:hypothetical protein